jgi:putative sterol carrier protein
MMATPGEYFEKLGGKLTAEKAAALGAIFQFNVEGDNGGIWVVDLTKQADFISEGDSDTSECTITMSETDFMDLVEGRLAGPQAFMLGKLKIDGNMGLAMKLGSVLGG